MYVKLLAFFLMFEKILEGLREELTARVEWTKEDLEHYSEQLNAVNKALEELKKLKK